MEKRDLYDLNRNLTGETIIKGQKYSNDKRILVVIIFIQNSKGEFLLQKRSAEKDGLWASTGGHPTTGQTSLEGIITEVKEEIGIDITGEKIVLFDSNSDAKVFCDLYYLNKDINVDDLIFQKEEVETAKWMNIEEIKIFNNKKEFKKSHLEALKICLKYLNIDNDL